MNIQRTYKDNKHIRVYPLPENISVTSIRGDGREIMRHSDGSLHASLVSNQKIDLFAITKDGDHWKSILQIDTADSSIFAEPATDSNANGVYVAYTKGDKLMAGYVATIPDPFNAPSTKEIHGPLTEKSTEIRGTFLQASSAFNSVVYGWHDLASGIIYVGVSKDGKDFPAAKALVESKLITGGPGVAIHGNYVIAVYQSSSSGVAGDITEYFVESDDAGVTWSEPKILMNSNSVPTLKGLRLSSENLLLSSEIKLSDNSTQGEGLQVLAWPANPEAQFDEGNRLFAMTTREAKESISGEDWSNASNAVGLLCFKGIGCGGQWSAVVPNKALFMASDFRDGYAGAIGTQFKYSALPQTPVRAVCYIESSPKVGERIILLLSTDTGATWPHQQEYSPIQLGLSKDARLRISNSACLFVDANGDLWLDLLFGDQNGDGETKHVMLPAGFNVQGIDATQGW